MLQTEPQLQEILGITEKGHDYYSAIYGRPGGYRWIVWSNPW